MFYIDDVKLCCVLCMWKENRCKDYSVIDFIWDFTRQRGTLSCWCEEVLYWLSEVQWWNGQEDWRNHWEHSKRHVQESWWKKRKKRKGKEGKSSRVSEMKVRRHRRRKLKLLREACEYRRVSNEDDIKGKECSSKLLELNIVWVLWKRSNGWPWRSFMWWWWWNCGGIPQGCVEQ